MLVFSNFTFMSGLDNKFFSYFNHWSSPALQWSQQKLLMQEHNRAYRLKMRITWDQHNCISSTDMYCTVSLLTPNTKPPSLTETGKSSTAEPTDSVYQQYYPRRALPILSHVGKNRITELPAFCKHKYGVVLCSTPYMELIRGDET